MKSNCNDLAGDEDESRKKTNKGADRGCGRKSNSGWLSDLQTQRMLLACSQMKSQSLWDLGEPKQRSRAINPAIAGEHLSHKTAGILSTVFDVGGVFGGISAGIISDKLGARATISFSFLLLSIPTLVLYRLYGSTSMYFNIVLMFLSGYFVNGPYSLITTAVAADLGTQDAISGNSRALATVTAILDGTGSIGAALGPLLTGYVSTRGWNSVFAMLIISTSLAILFLIQPVKAEVSSKINDRQDIKISSVRRYSEC